MPIRRRTLVQLDPTDRELPRIGHNRGPRLDMSYEAWAWRRAYDRAWTPPSREIALRRLRHAERLGLSYRDYTSVLMDRGTHLGAAIFAPGVLDSDRAQRAMRERLAAIGDCRVLLAVAGRDGLDPAIEGRVDAVAIVPEEAPAKLAAAIAQFLGARRLPPSAAFMIGGRPWHLRAAEEAGLALFKWAANYFPVT